MRKNRKTQRRSVISSDGHRYLLIRRIGRGGSSEVWQAFCFKSGRNYAMKIRKKDSVTGRTPYVRCLMPLEAEARLLKMLTCLSDKNSMEAAGIPHFAGWFQDGEKEYLLMQYLRGRTIGEKLRNGEFFSVREVLRIGRDLCSLLLLMHEKADPVLYLDLSPDNVWLDRSERVWLTDFGAAAVWKWRAEMKEKIMYGTPGYAAPEQYRGKAELSSDIYSLGMLLRQMWKERDTGNPEEKKAVPGMKRFLVRCTLEEPSARYQNIGEVRDELERLADYIE